MLIGRVRQPRSHFVIAGLTHPSNRISSHGTTFQTGSNIPATDSNCSLNAMTIQLPFRLFWVSLLVVLLGLAPTRIAHAAVSAQTVQNTVNSDAFRAAFVGDVYQTLLGRAASSTEAAPLVAQLKGGGKAWQNVVVSVAGSPAYFQKAGNNNASFVNHLFADMVGRAPDAGEEAPAALDYLKGGGSRTDLAGVVADTDEFRQNWTQKLYQKLLGHAATDAEATAGAAKLGTGGWNALAAQVLASPQFFQKSGNSQSGWQNAVNQLLVTDESGMNGDTSNGGAGDMGTPTTTPDYPTTTPATMPMNNSRATMVQALLASPEYFSNVVQGTYQKFLRRGATPPELSQWSGAMQGGASSDQVMMSVLTSDEYFNRAGGTTTGYLNRLSQDLLGKSGGSFNGKNNLPSTGDLLDMFRKLPRHKK